MLKIHILNTILHMLMSKMFVFHFFRNVIFSARLYESCISFLTFGDNLKFPGLPVLGHTELFSDTRVLKGKSTETTQISERT